MEELETGVRGIHHPGIVVSDLESAVEFYSAFLGMTKVYDESWEVGDTTYDQGVGLSGSAARGVMLRGHNTYLELWEYRAPAQRGPDPAMSGANELGFRHLSIEVDDVHVAWTRLQDLGGTAMGAPVEFDKGRGGAVYARDPFGNIIELTTAGEFPPPISELPVSGDGAASSGE